MIGARFVEGAKVQEIAKRFGASFNRVQSRIRDYKKGVDEGKVLQFFEEPKPGPKGDRKKPEVREQVLRLRARRYSDQDIQKALKLAGFHVSVSLIDQVLREEGLSSMGKRTKEEREEVGRRIRSGEIPGLTVPPPAAPRRPEVADVGQLKLEAGRRVYSRVAGVFLLVPFLVTMQLEDIVDGAKMAGSKMIPAVS